jgi:uncharacterized protein YeaO (DUF488 family)
MICTTSFENYRHLKDENLIGISIARRAPAWFLKKPNRILEYKKLAPMVFFDRRSTQEGAWDEFVTWYMRQLDRLNPYQVVADLREMSGRGVSIALLCWEEEPTHCHRRLVAEWLQAQIKIEVVELEQL